MPIIDVRLPPSNHGPQNLARHSKQVLSQIFAEYERVVVTQSFQSGFSGSQVLLVRPIIQGNDAELPAVIKIDRVETMDSEWDAYKTYIHRKLPNAVPMEGQPVNPRGSSWAGALYNFAGGRIFTVVSLQEFIETHKPQEIVQLFAHLSKSLQPLQQKRHIAPEFHFRARYDRILPINFEVDCDQVPTENPRWLDPSHIPFTVDVNQTVMLHQFTVTKRRSKKNSIICSTNEHIDGDFHFIIYNLPDDTWDQLQPGDVLHTPITGTVTETRHAFLQKKQQLIFGEAPPQYSYQDSVLPDPITNLNGELNKSQDINIAPIHGDLNLQNILVDTDNTISYMIDFAQTRVDHVLRDMIHLEMAVVTTVLSNVFAQSKHPLTDLVEWYERLHCATENNQFETLPQKWSEAAWERPFTALLAVRRMAQKLLTRQDQWDEYYRGLYLYMVGCLKYPSLYKNGKGEADQEFLSAKIAYLTAAIALAFTKQPPVADHLSTEPRAKEAGQAQPAPRQEKEGQTPERIADPKTLRMLLQKRYRLSELKTLCFDLGVDYEDLEHSNRTDLARELVQYCGYRDMYQQLADTIPDEIWRLGL